MNSWSSAKTSKFPFPRANFKKFLRSAQRAKGRKSLNNSSQALPDLALRWIRPALPRSIKNLKALGANWVEEQDRRPRAIVEEAIWMPVEIMIPKWTTLQDSPMIQEITAQRTLNCQCSRDQITEVVKEWMKVIASYSSSEKDNPHCKSSRKTMTWLGHLTWTWKVAIIMQGAVLKRTKLIN